MKNYWWLFCILFLFSCTTIDYDEPRFDQLIPDGEYYISQIIYENDYWGIMEPVIEGDMIFTFTSLGNDKYRVETYGNLTITSVESILDYKCIEPETDILILDKNGYLIQIDTIEGGGCNPNVIDADEISGGYFEWVDNNIQFTYTVPTEDGDVIVTVIMEKI